MATAKIKFIQGPNTDIAGRAVFGTLVDGAVACSNFDDANIAEWQWKLLEVPLGSAVPLGVFSILPTGFFLPDVRGGYVVELTVTDELGVETKDVRVFGVKETSGRFVPPYLADDNNMNFAGQNEGWSLYVNEYLRQVDTLSALPSGHVIQMAGVPLTQRPALNFVGFQVIDDADSSDVINSLAQVEVFADLAALPAGVGLAYVVKRRSFFTRNTLGGWERLPAPSLTWASQANWYVGGPSGNDDNDGATLATPLATAGELIARIMNQTLQQTTTIRQLGDLDETVRYEVELAESQMNGGSLPRLLWVGDPTAATIVHTGTLTTVTNLNAASDVNPSFTDSTAVDFATMGTGGESVENYRLRIIGGASLGAVAHVTKVLGAQQLQTSAWTILDPLTSGSITQANTNPAAGSSYVIERLPKLRSFDGRIRHGGRAQSGITFLAQVVADMEIGTGVTNVAETFAALDCSPSNRLQSAFSRCRLKVGIVAGDVNLLATNHHGDLCSFAGRTIAGGCANVTTSYTLVIAPYVKTINRNWICRISAGTGSLVIQSPTSSTLDGFGVFQDGTGTAVSVPSAFQGNVMLIGGRLWGKAAGNVGLTIEGGRDVLWRTTKPSIKGSVLDTNDVRINGTNFGWVAIVTSQTVDGNGVKNVLA